MLAPGTRIGPYEILSPIGAGGMGEVYRARDAKLGRDAAIKILPDLFLNDAERVARFEREARTLASLNHANIAQIYGLEDRALVMELVEGEDLSALVARGPVPLHDALPIARQIAQALEAAHEAGIIHRDLKPANIKVRPDGTVKVLDFGLAKATDAPYVGRTGVGSAGTADRSSVRATNEAPTMTSPAMTEMGMILGTAAYMSPEQARGKAVDRRADVWAFGVVLYEMLSGRRAFTGSEVSDVLASVLKDAPPLERLPAETPPAIRRLLRRCLEKDRADRLDSMAAARLDIADALESRIDDAATTTHAPARPTSRARTLGVPVAAALAGAALTAAVLWQLLQPPAPEPLSFALTAPGGGALGMNVNQPDLAISPDGRRIVYGDGQTDSGGLILRSLDGFGDTRLQGLGLQARSPFFSPDGKWIGYFAAVDSGFDARLMKLPVGGGAPIEIAKVKGNLRGASWGADGTIVFATTAVDSGLFRVSATGGTPELISTPDAKAGEVDHVWPHLLPDGKHAVFAISRRSNDPGSSNWDLAAIDLSTRTWRVLPAKGSFPAYVPTGHLLYASDSGLWAVAFDPVTIQMRGEPTILIGDVAFKTASGAADVGVSATGTIAYIGGGGADTSALVWVDRQGQVSRIASPPRRYLSARISPDGQRAAVVVDDSGAPAIWTFDFGRETLMRVTPPGLSAFGPVWSETGRDIYFSGTTGREGGIYTIPASGAGASVLLMPNPKGSRLVPTGTKPNSPDLLVDEWAAEGSRATKVLTPGAIPVLTPLLGNGRESEPLISPNGRWLAYTAEEGGRREVFLRPYPDLAADRIRVSGDGGRFPRWAEGGRELFFLSTGGAIWVVAVGDAGSRSVGKPVRLPDPGSERLGPGDLGFDVTPDGQRILRITRQTSAEGRSELRVVTHWFEVVKAQFAGGK